MNINFLTVATVSYLQQALVTLRSARDHNDFSSIYVFVLDAPLASIQQIELLLGPDSEWLNVFGPDSLDDDLKSLFLKTSHYFTRFEMSCLAKYVGIMHVLKAFKSPSKCVFADSDILFLTDINDALEELNNNAMLITPHQFKPSTDAVEHDYLLNGWINAGFFVVNGQNFMALDILRWLIDRISRRGFVAPGYGLFCDQAWLSLLPGVYNDSIVISRLVGYNVGYWNLGEREIEFVKGVFTVNAQPLTFFHFSGFLGAKRGLLTKHNNFKVVPGSVIGKLCEKYQILLEENDGFDFSRLKVKKFSKANLTKRIALGSKINKLNIESPTVRRGLFTRIGSKLDVLVAKLMN